MSPVILILSVIPKNLISYLTGAIVRIRPPSVLSHFLNKAFVNTFNIDMSEAEHPLSNYKSIEDVFTRKLKEGSRPLGKGSYCAPCDGVLSLNEKIENGQEQALQAKGSSYSISELVFGKNETNSSFTPTWASTFYLAPHNYHRVHSPLSGLIKSIKHVPGTLWPVNPKFLGFVPRLFAQNERLVFDIETEGGGSLYLVMVGAFNVGRITTPFSKNLITNNIKGRSKVTTENLSPPLRLKKGEEIGTFLLGSTVVLVFDEKAFKDFSSPPKEFSGKQNVKMGESLLIEKEKT